MSPKGLTRISCVVVQVPLEGVDRDNSGFFLTYGRSFHIWSSESYQSESKQPSELMKKESWGHLHLIRPTAQEYDSSREDSVR
jgi:hypothetical protein